MSYNTKIARFPTTLNRPIRLSTFGDSTANLGFSKTRIDTIVPTQTDEGYEFKGNICPVISKGLYTICANGGIIGNTTQNMVDRAETAYSDTRKAPLDIIKSKPDVVFFHGGSVNDLTSLPVDEPQATLDAIVNRHMNIVKLFTSVGIYVVDSGILGYDGTGGETAQEIAARRGYLVYINSKIQEFALLDHLHKFVDVDGTISNDGAFITNVSSDGVHLSNYGAMLLGTLEQPVIDRLFNVNIFTDKMFDFEYLFANNTDGVPLGCALAKTNVTSYTPTTDSTIMEIPFDVTTATGSISLSFNISETVNPFLPFSSGDLLGIGLDLALDDSNGDPVNFELKVFSQIFNQTNTASYYTIVSNTICNGASKSSINQALIQDPATIGANSVMYLGVSSVPVGTGYVLKMKPPFVFKIQ